MIFVTASLSLLLLDRLKHPAIPGYILTGVILGQLVLKSQLLDFAQLGVLFLVFVFGLKLEPRRLRSVAAQSLDTAVTTVIITGASSYLAALLLGLPPTEAVYFSLAASLSSSLVGMELIDERLRIDLLHGRLAESIHLLQDALAVGFILVTSAVAAEHELMALGQGLLVFGVAVVSREFLPEVISARERDQEAAVLASLAALTLFVAMADFAGLPMIVGSFAAGLSLAKFPFNEETIEFVQPLKDFFSVVFFVALGSLIGFPSLGTVVLTALLLVFTLAFKPLLTAFHLIESGFDHRTSYLTGLSLDQVSEFALVVVIQAFTTGVISRPVFESVVLSASISMVVSSYSNRHGAWIYRKLDALGVQGDMERRRKVSSVDQNISGHVVVVGYGVKGRRVVQKLDQKGYKVVVIENDPEKLSQASKEVENYVLGDATTSETWRRAKAETADALVSTVEDPRISERALEAGGNSRVFLTSSTVSEASELLQAGADLVDYPGVLESTVIVEHLSSALQDENYAEKLRRRKMLELRRETSGYQS